MVIHAVGLKLDNLLILLDRTLQDILGSGTSGIVAQRPQVDAAQQLMCFQVIGVALQNVLRFKHRIADASGFGIEFGQT